VFENGVLGKIFVCKRDEGREGWRSLQIEELDGVYCSPSIVWVIKSRIMRQTGAFGEYGEQGKCLTGF
jgi:hypothetical protein